MSKVYATINGFVGHGGLSVPINEGEEYDLDAPIVQAHPQWFTAKAPASAVVAADKAKKRSPRG